MESNLETCQGCPRFAERALCEECILVPPSGKREVAGVTFLHNHPGMEQSLLGGRLSSHVIIDREEWTRVVRFMDENPFLFNQLLKSVA